MTRVHAADATGKITEFQSSGRPYGIALDKAGNVWFCRMGADKLGRIDGAGIVWANEINTDTVVRLDPATGDMRVVELPTKSAGIRKMIVDARGRLWHMGSHNGRLGVVE